MNLTEELLPDFDDDPSDLHALQRPAVNPLSARRSLERLLEQRALRSRLKDDLDESQNLDDLDW